MKFLSYAQNFEDVMLWRALQHIKQGFYIDVGANDPSTESVTKAFYERGWSGINIEPLAAHHGALKHERPRDINLRCAAGASRGELDFWEFDIRGWATASEDVVAMHRANGHEGLLHKVPVVPLAEICAAHVKGDIHFLKIDVEGLEKQVIEGMDFARYRPWILVIEAIKPNSTSEVRGEWESMVLGQGYQLAYMDGLNGFYAAQEHPELIPRLRYPPNVLDNFIRQDLSNEDQLHFHERVREAEARAQDAEARAQDAAARLRRVEQHNRQLTTSTSWRVTRPLRQATTQLRHVARLLKNTTREGARHTLSALLGQLRKHPGIRGRIVQLANNSPALKQRLTGILWYQKATDTRLDGQDRPATPETSLANPLPHGRRIIYFYVDHTSRCPTNSGVQRVARSLARALLAAGETVRYIKWDPATRQCAQLSADERANLSNWDGPPPTAEDAVLYPPQHSSSRPLGPHSPAENNWLIVPEVPHINFHNRPLTLDVILWSRRMGLKNAFVYYDAIPLKLEEHDALAEKHAQYMQHLLLADVVWPISDWSQADLLAYWRGHQNADTQTIPELNTLPLPGEIRGARATGVTSGKQQILSVGTIEPRKNQATLVRAFRNYLAKHLGSPWRLVLIGNLHPLAADEINRAIAAEARITHLGNVTEQDLHDQYQQANFTVFPSVEEGFGLPILESLWHGKPCLCANFGAMAEVARNGGCLTVDTRNENALEVALTTLIEDRALHDKLAIQAIAAPMLSWQDYARQVSQRLDREVDSGSQVGPIYYWIDATLQFDKNTGIQRVARQLARGMLANGMALIPVKWDAALTKISPVTTAEREFFAQWNGPPPDRWQPWVAPEEAGAGAWLLVPDLPLNRSTSERRQLVQQAHHARLRCASIFYDAIPWKMRHIYPPHFATAHREYMIGLADYDRVFPISAHSRDDLIQFLGRELPRPQSLEDKIRAILLPGEFPEHARVTRLAPVAESNSDRKPLTILCVGTVEPRKNHETLLRAFRRCAEATRVPLKLIIVGGDHSTEPALADRVRAVVAADPRITWEEHADDQRLGALHASCDLTVYPSIEEGFGLPILESLWCGKPCLCADFGAMLEAAAGGGCSTVDVRDEQALASALLRIVDDCAYRQQLSLEATTRSVTTWRDYATSIARQLAIATPQPAAAPPVLEQEEMRTRFASLRQVPHFSLSVCISTYNRAGWLATSLKNWATLYPQPFPGVELFVCDNSSTDTTPDVVKPYLARADFRYRRNLENVGMLGNLRETAQAARGRYIWILGDDDLLMPGAIEHVLAAIDGQQELTLVYLNYAYTRIEDSRTVTDFDKFFADATPITPAVPNQVGSIKDLCAHNENFFTAIYTLVLRRDHALRAYSQDTTGRPFTSPLTCIPTTHYILNHMMETQGVWIGSPQVVVNMNVSWMKYAPLWVLERLPEVYEIAERKGAAPDQVDRWRRQSIQGVCHYFNEILTHDPLDNARFFNPARLLRRYKHLHEFEQVIGSLEQIYKAAHATNSPAARIPPQYIFLKSN